MKTHFFLLFLFISILTISIKAQDTKFGMKAGLNMVSFNGDHSDLIGKGESGFLVGIVYDYVYTDRISVEFNALYAHTEAYNDLYSDDSSSMSIGYLNFPLLFKYYFTPNINIQAGPEFSVHAISRFTNGDDAITLFKESKTSAVIGAEYKFNMGLTLSVRYALGLTSILADYDDYQSVDPNTSSLDVKYNSTQIGVTFLF